MYNLLFVVYQFTMSYSSSWPLPAWQGEGIYFWGGSTHDINSVTTYDNMMMRMMASRGLCLIQGPESGQGPGILYISKF